jgi:tape measure domain-containing protein
LSATLGLDDSAYRQGIQNVQSETKKTVSSLSGEYSKAAKAVVELTRRYNESVGKTGKASSETKNLKTMLAQAEAQLRATTTALKAANNGMDGFASSTDKASGKSLAGAIAQGTIMAGVFSKIGSAALSAAEGFIQSGIDYNAQIESYTVGFTNMLGSAEAARQAIDQIQQDAARTPFSVEALTQANQLLIGAGENATYAEKTIMALGNAVSATGGSNAELSRMAANLQQIANVGKASAIDIKQFAYAGINIYGLLADYTGKSTAEVQKMTISYDLLTQALQAASEEGGRYYNSMDAQSQTMNGRVSTLQDNVKQLAGLLTGDLSSGVGVVIGNLNDLIVKAQEAYKTDGWIGLAGAITGLTEPINTAKNAFKDFASKATTWLDQLSYKLNRFLGKAATADFDTYEEYADANNRQSNRNRLRQNALKGVGISNKSWSERQAELAAANGSGGSSIVTTGGGGGKKSTGKKSTTEKVIASVSNTVTTSAMNALGAVTTSVETLQEKVKDSAGKIKDRVTTTTTETGKEMVNGVATTYKKVNTVVDGVVTKTTKVYDDMSKVLTGTLTKVAENTFAGITTKVQEATETYADGSEHVKRTVTETGERIVNGAAETYEKVVTYVDGVKDKATETATAIDNSVKGVQSRIEQYLSGASEESGKGIFGIIKNIVNDAKNQDWGGIALDITNLIWGEVSQGQREVISKWFVDAMGAVNEAYSGGGLSNAFDAVKAIFGNGITKNADGVTMAIKGVTTEVKSLGEIVNGLAGSGGVGGAIGSIIQSFSGMASGITSALGTIVSFVAANPILALILGLGAVAGGIGIAAWANSRKNKSPVSHYRSPFEDAGVYDSLSEFSTRAALQYRVTGQQSIVDRQTSILERIEGMLDEHLPDIGKGQVVMDSGELVGVLSPRMATNVDARIGVTVTRKARGV